MTLIDGRYVARRGALGARGARSGRGAPGGRSAPPASPPSPSLPAAPSAPDPAARPASPPDAAAPTFVQAASAPPPPTALVERDATGFGPLERFIVEPGVTDIFINGPNDLWVDRGGGLVHVPDWSCPSESHLRELAVRLVALGGRHIDEATPCVDVRIGEGIRLHAVLPPVSPHGTLVSVRLPRLGLLRLDDLGRSGFFTATDGSETAHRAIVEAAVCERSNVLITGAGGSGKTTFLSALLSAAPADERIVAIEDVAELRVEHPHFVSLEARQPNLEGAGGISLERLLREALRMRPDRLVLGECRGAEIRELLSALNTGHDGGAGTLHANSLADVPARLEALGTLAGLNPEAIARQAVSAINLIVHIERRGSHRRLAGLGVFALDRRGRLEVRDRATGMPAVRGAAAPAARRTAVGTAPPAARRTAVGTAALDEAAARLPMPPSWLPAPASVDSPRHLPQRAGGRHG